MSLPDPAAATQSNNPLFAKFKLNNTLELQNHIAMAPMTRSFATNDLVPTPEIAAYYARRASAGLIISEATLIRADGQGYPNTPGLFSEAQVEGWKPVLDAVHKRGATMFAQLWHVGRASHPFYLKGKLPLAPSAIALSGTLPRRRDLTYGTPRAVTRDEIQGLLESYATAAANARRAGFDGVELHAANGYLLDQFLHYDTNRRTDAYGGSPENMTRFPLEVVTAVSEQIGAERTALRLSPQAYMNIEPDRRDAQVFSTLLEQLNRRTLAYLHSGIFDDSQEFDFLGGQRVTEYLRNRYKGVFISNGALEPTDSAAGLLRSDYDLVSFGRPFIANPDLIERLQSKRALTPYNQDMLHILH